MKIALKCNSRLLESALEYYLKDFISDESDANFIITDQLFHSLKPLFLISKDESANLHSPFTKKMLFDAIERFYYQISDKSEEEREIEAHLSMIQKRKDAKLKKILSKIDEE
jgi:hypothetical protein